MTPERLAKTEGMIEKWGPLACSSAVSSRSSARSCRSFPAFPACVGAVSPVLRARRLCWSTLFTLLGYFFGGIPAVQKHFELVIIAILVLSLIPTFVGLLKAKFGKKKADTATAEA